MTRTRITRLAAATVATGVASLAFAAPAVAMESNNPGNTGTPGETAPSPSDETPWMEITIGALGGLALAGAGVAAAQSVRRRQAVSPV